MPTKYTVAYLVYTIGTLIVAPASLHIGAMLSGLAAVFAMAGAVIGLALNSNKQLKTEYALKVSKR